MSTHYWYRTCPFCDGQGLLTIYKDITNNRMYLHCGECESGWVNPEDIDKSEKRFLTLLEDFETELPTYEEIISYGWKKYAKHSFEE